MSEFSTAIRRVDLGENQQEIAPRRRLYQFGIRGKLCASLFAITAVILLVSSFLDVLGIKERGDGELDHTAELIANRLSKALVLPLWEMEEEKIREIVRSEMTDLVVAAVLVRGSDGRGLIYGDRRNAEGKVESARSEIEGKYVTGRKDILRQRIGDKTQDIRIGTVEVYLIRELLDREVKREILVIALKDFFLLLVIVITLYFSISRLIVNPIFQIVGDLRENRGDLTRRIELQLNDEMGELVAAFNDLATNLVEVIRRESQISLELELQVQERTTANRQLEEEIARANEMALRAQAANVAKSQFLANMSHEIRTPMNGILGMTEILLGTSLSDKQHEVARTVLRSGEALLSILNDILDFSKIEAGRLELEQIDFDVRQCVEDVAELLAERAHNKGLELACHILEGVPSQLCGDPIRLRQILTNLLNNAIKFTERGEVVVSASTIEDSENSVLLRFEVSDTGIGIDPEVQRRIFDAFSQADDSTTRKYGGTGLGLAISKQLCEMMNGEITVESVQGVGSTFSATAWFARQTKDQKKTLIPRFDLNGVRVLIVDDNDTNRTILMHQISSWQMAGEYAEDGPHALEMLETAVSRGAPYDIAILDMMMPGMNGLELARIIKSRPNIADIRLIMLTSVGQYGDPKRSEREGILAYLTKPVRQSQLYDCLVHIMSGTWRESNDRLAATSDVKDQDAALLQGHILLAEDNEVNQQVARHRVETLGCTVDVVETGLGVLDALSGNRYDLILMDCQMPEMDGYTAARLIRATEAEDASKSTHIPIIALTAHAMEGDRARCIEAGMDDYLSKPFTQARLQSVLAHWLPERPAASAADTGDFDTTEPVVVERAEHGETRLDDVASSAMHSDKDHIDHTVWNELRAMDKGGTTGLLHSVLKTYLEKSPQWMQILREAVGKADTAEIHKMAHSLKSSNASVGALKIAASCEALELAARSNSIENAPRLLAQIEAEYLPVTEILAAEVRRECVCHPMSHSVEEERPKVLLADDDPTVRLPARVQLEQIGFEVIEAEDGEQALSVFENSQPDMVLLDVMMPKMDGFAVCGALRRFPGHEHTPILMVTGLNDIESINRAYELGATDFITKPLSWPILGHRVQYMWRGSQANQELRKSEERTRKSEEKNLALLNAIPDLMLQIGRDGTILDFKKPKDFHSILSLGDLAGKKVDESLYLEADEPVTPHVERALRTRDIQVCEHQFQVSGVQHYHESRIVVCGDDEVLAIVRDITERKNAEARITQLAYYDTLTGLLNRHSFKENLGLTLAHANRYNHLTAVMFLDLDRFKQVNDSLGHSIGDMLLQAVSDRLVNCVRKSDIIGRSLRDPAENAVARLGGDEFILLLSRIGYAEEAAVVAQRILDAISKPFVLAGHEVFIGSSLGISIYPYDGEDTDTLLKNADAAMYYAKDQGRNNYQFYNRSLTATALERLTLESSMRRALEREEFLLCYQPQISIQTGQIVGTEALIRWQHPDLGYIAPNQFIPLAEEVGLIAQIGEWVLHSACRQNGTWREDGFESIRVSVNVSSYQFRQESFIEIVAGALDNSGLNPSCLELELTESAVMQDVERTARLLHRLKAMGVRVAIDDFGTGYSSLAYLRRFPIDVLKIDRSFIRDVTTNSDDAAIAMAIIALAHKLNLEVVAEGVEMEEQFEFLRENNCDVIQGYIYSPPVSADAMTSMLGRGNAYMHRKTCLESGVGQDLACSQ